MTRFQPKNPDFRAIATDTFDQQRAMETLGAGARGGPSTGVTA
jgi:hypothetical protein